MKIDTNIIPTWKTIIIGDKSKEKILKELDNFEVSGWAKEMINNVEFGIERQELELVRTTLGELGFTDYPTTKELMARITEKGFGLCPQETGPYLRVAYDDQSPGEWLYVMSEPISGADGNSYVFSLGRDSGGLWLRGYWADPGVQWSLDDELVLLRRKCPSSSELGTKSLDTLPSALSPDTEAIVSAIDRLTKVVEKLGKAKPKKK